MVATSADAATGDTAKMGEWNHAGKQTVFTSGAGTTVMIRNTKAGKIPLDLQATPGTPPLKVNRAAWVQNLNADLLDDYQAHQLIRVAHAESPNVDETGWGTGENTALTTTITAPTAGFLVINTHAYVGGNDRFYCLIEVDNVEVTGGRIFGQQNAGEGLCTSMGTKAVAAGVRTVTFIMGDRTDSPWMTPPCRSSSSRSAPPGRSGADPPPAAERRIGEDLHRGAQRPRWRSRRDLVAAGNR